MKTATYMGYRIKQTQDSRWHIVGAPRGRKVFPTLKETKQRVDGIIKELADRLSKQHGPLLFVKYGRRKEGTRR